MNNIEKLAIEKQPQIKPLWLVIDEQGYPIHCASYKEACNEHINDAINDFDLTDAKYWKVVEAVPKALQSSEPVAWRIKHEDDDEWDISCDKPITVGNYEVQPLFTLPPSTVTLEEHNKRIAELEADIDTYVPIANQQATEIMQLQATNKTLLDAIERYEKHGVTCQTYRYFIDVPCAECNVQAIADAAVDVSETEKLDKISIDFGETIGNHDCVMLDELNELLDRSPSVSAPTIPEAYALDAATIRSIYRLWKHLEETPIRLYKRFKDAEKAMLSANQGSDKDE